jgi:hypothetical protein
MPVNAPSRYRGLPKLTVGIGAEATTGIARRPQPLLVEPALTHVLTGVETIEYLAGRYLGRSSSWWHIADANPLAFPLDWRAGQALALPPRTSIGRVTRTREV